MSRQVALAGEAAVADLTDVRPFPCVPPPVDGQRGPLRERLGALVALVRLLACVDPPVHPQVLRVGEALAADVADVRFLAGVDAPVLLQMLGAAEALAAVVAQVQFRRIVALLVTEQGPLRGEDAAADVAGGAGHLVRLQLGMHAPAMGGELPS